MSNPRGLVLAERDAIVSMILKTATAKRKQSQASCNSQEVYESNSAAIVLEEIVTRIRKEEHWK